MSGDSTVSGTGSLMSPSPVRRLCLIVNPVAGGHARPYLAKVIAALKGAGCETTMMVTRAPGDAERICREASSSRRYDAIAVAGGDGTVNECANGLADASLPLAIIPMGTANVLALEYGYPRAPSAIAAMIRVGKTVEIWPGRAGGRLFLAMASCGFDGRVMARVTAGGKRMLGKAAYALGAIGEWMGGHLPRLLCRCGGSEVRASWLMVMKTGRYAGRFVIAPGAVPGRPGFQVVAFTGSDRWSLARFVVATGMGRIAKARDVRFLEGDDIVIEGAGEEPFEMDGDLVGALPVHIENAAFPLRLLVP